MRILILALSLLALTSCGARGTIGKACSASSRSAANPALCSCIQQAADSTLSASEQRRAAAFFDDPEAAQAARSQGGTFWTRYKRFTSAAERRCD